MKAFSELGIKSPDNFFVGEKIKIAKILNRKIIVRNFKIEKSKYPKNKSGNVLTLQIEINNEDHILFTGSDFLINQINQIKEADMPFETIIEKSGEHFEFK